MSVKLEPEAVANMAYDLLSALVDAQNKFTFRADDGGQEADVTLAAAKAVAACLLADLAMPRLERLEQDNPGVGILEWVKRVASAIEVKAAYMDRDTYSLTGGELPKVKA